MSLTNVVQNLGQNNTGGRYCNYKCKCEEEQKTRQDNDEFSVGFLILI